MAPAALATLEFSKGTVVHYRGNYASTDEPTNWGGVWRMECARGVIHWTTRGDHGDQVRMVRSGRKERILPLPKSIKLDREGSLAAFARAIRSGMKPDTAGEDNLRTLECMLAAVDAAESGVPVTLRPANRRA